MNIDKEIKKLEALLRLIEDQEADASRDRERSAKGKRSVKTRKGWKVKTQ